MYVFRGKSSAKEPWWPCIIMDPIRISGNAMKTWQKKQEAPGSKFAPKDFYIVMWYDPRYSNTFTCLDARYICRPQCFFFFTALTSSWRVVFLRRTCPLMFVCPFLFSFFFLCLRCSIFFCLSFLISVKYNPWTKQMGCCTMKEVGLKKLWRAKKKERLRKGWRMQNKIFCNPISIVWVPLYPEKQFQTIVWENEHESLRRTVIDWII